MVENTEQTYSDPAEELAELRKKVEGFENFQKETKGTFWALLFLLSEMSGGIFLLRQLLTNKGVISKEDHDEVNKASLDPAFLQNMYANTEEVFRERYDKTRFALENPDKVEEMVEAMKAKEEETKAEEEAVSDSENIDPQVVVNKGGDTNE
jgi:hypothetical protein